MKLISTSVAALMALALSVPVASAADEPVGPDVSMTMELAGFSEDGAQFAVKIKDEEMRSMYQVRTTKKNQLVASYPFEEGKEKSAWRKVKRKHKMGVNVPSDGPENPKTGMTLMTAQKKDKINIYVMVSETCTKLYASVQLKTITKGKKKGTPAESMVKSVNWDSNGKYAVVVFHQKLKTTFAWEGDGVYPFKLKKYKAKCSAPE